MPFDAEAEGWREAPFSALADYANGRAFRPEEWGTSGLPIVRIAQITNPEAETNYFDGRVEERHLIDDGDLIFSWSATLAIMKWSRGPAVLNQHLFKVTPAPGIDRAWLQYRLEASIPALAEEAHGTTMKHIRKGTLSSQTTLVPPLDEQRRIAEVLQSVDAAAGVAAAAAEQALRTYRTLSSTLLSDEPRDGWCQKTVAEVCEILDARRVPLNSNERRSRKGPYPYWGANDVVDFIDDYLFDEPLVLMAEDGGFFDQSATRPICNRLDEKVWVNNHAHVIRPTRVTRDFFYFWFVHRDITPHIKGGTRTKLNQGDLRRLPILVPYTEKQEEITGQLNAAIKACEAAVRVAEVHKKLKGSAGSELLSGRVRVPG